MTIVHLHVPAVDIPQDRSVMDKLELMETYPELVTELIQDAIVDQANELMGYTHEFRNPMHMLQRCANLMYRDASWASTRLQRRYEYGQNLTEPVKPLYN